MIQLVDDGDGASDATSENDVDERGTDEMKWRDDNDEDGGVFDSTSGIGQNGAGNGRQHCAQIGHARMVLHFVVDYKPMLATTRP